ncbi:MAG: ribosomal protein S18-alanine N-acetyltransferase [Methanobacteriaceae archaeon]|nr:ribosomal protein S18-alanine N-acetyltransferase [Methanobacteriaceae archaeon]
MADIVFCLMTVKDIDQVVEIERGSFHTPWSKEAFVNELTKNPLALYFVGKVDECIIAYAGTWIVHGEAHITNIAVHPRERGKHFGDALSLQLLQGVAKRGVDRATLEVRVSNEVAQKMYRKLGFIPVGIRPGYYTDTCEDALIMWKDILKVKEDVHK